MKNSRQWMVPVLVTVAALACTKPASKPDSQADVAAINGVRERELAFVNTGNLDSLMTVYSSDIVSMPPQEPAVTGQDGIRKWGEAMFAQVALNVRYTSSEVSVSGDWAVDRYTATLTATPKAGGSAVAETIKGVHIMKRQPDGTWRIAQDVWNSDAPLPSSPPLPATK